MRLLERESALDALGGWFAEARAGSGRLVLVGGEAGVGKTTLVDEFARRNRPAGRFLRGGCDPLTTPRPLGPLADVAPALGGRLDRLLRAEAPREALFPALLDRLTGSNGTISHRPPRADRPRRVAVRARSAARRQGLVG